MGAACAREGGFLRGTVGDTVNSKELWHKGANYPRISCTGVPKRGDVRITVTLEPALLSGTAIKVLVCKS